jgi:8-amino-7-oxononanoate synthase
MNASLEDYLAALETRLGELEAAGLRRRLEEPRGIDFASNDTLGLARHPLLLERLEARLRERRGEPLFSPSSRLISGTTPFHLEIEARLARFKGTEAALLFPSGYQANIGVLMALLGPEDRALSDALNHASLIDGLRLGGARKVVHPHLDLPALERAASAPHPGGRTFIVTESLFSADGDIARLDLYAEIAAAHGALLVVDDAHGTGLYGRERASGLTEHFRVERRAAATVFTFGKALGVAGACVAGPRAVIDTLVQRARPFIFTTAPPAFLLHAVDIALDLIEAMPGRGGRSLGLANRLRERLRELGIDGGGEGPIVPIVIGGNREAMEAAAALARRGFDVRALRPPSVPPGTARLRISVHADRTEEEVDGLAAAIGAVLAELGAPATRS